MAGGWCGYCRRYCGYEQRTQRMSCLALLLEAQCLPLGMKGGGLAAVVVIATHYAL